MHMRSLEMCLKIRSALVLRITKLAIERQFSPTLRRQHVIPISTFYRKAHVEGNGSGFSGSGSGELGTALDDNVLAQAVHGLKESQAVGAGLSSCHRVSRGIPDPVGQTMLQGQMGSKVHQAFKVRLANQTLASISGKGQSWWRLSGCTSRATRDIHGVLLVFRSRGCVELDERCLVGDFAKMDSARPLLAKWAWRKVSVHGCQLGSTNAQWCPWDTVVTNQVQSHVLRTTKPSVTQNAVIGHVVQEAFMFHDAVPVICENIFHECSAEGNIVDALFPSFRQGKVQWGRSVCMWVSTY